MFVRLGVGCAHHLRPPPGSCFGSGRVAGRSGIERAAEAVPYATDYRSMIRRIGPSRYSPTRSRIVTHQGVITTVAVSPDKSPSLYEQSRAALSVLDQHLAEAGTEKSKLLMVMIYLADVTAKAEFNRAWDEWVDRANLPLRACVGVALEGNDLVELVATAAV